ncbi:zinc finger, CCHC-type containing protein [Tanacetum coccineum]
MDYKAGNVSNKANRLGTKGTVDGSSNPLKGHNMFNKSLQVYYVTYVSEAHFVQDDDVAWWVDSGATVHHARLGYVHFKRMQDMSKNELIPTFDMDTENDMCDPHATPSLGNQKYFVTFIDDASRFCYVYLLHSQDEALDKFKVFTTEVELQQGFMIKRFRTDRGGIECSFVEHSKAFRFSSVPRPSQRSLKNGIEGSGGSVVSEEVVQQPDPELKKGKRHRTPKDFGSEFQLYLIKGIRDEVDETVERFKERLVIQGFKQHSGIDYFDTYALVVRISTIRLLIAMGSIYDLIIHQMDVKTAFLNGELEEEAPKQWNQKFDEVVLSNDYLLNQANKYVYSKFDESEGSEEIHYYDCTPVSTLIDTCEKLMPNKGQVVSQLDYFYVIGYLMYATTCTRLDIAFDVNKLSMYTSNPGTQYWQAIQRILKYLKKTIDYRLMYIGYPSVLEGYTDATLAAAGKEVEWLKNLLFKIPLRVKPIAPISIRCDSATTLAKAYSQMYNGKSRHLGVRHSMIRELITNRVVSIEFVRSQQNLADHLTKGLARDLVI